jgi:hypothetical protein
MTDDFQFFNLETMSGVSPGARSVQFERVHLQPLDQEGPIIWARVLWSAEPRTCTLYLGASGQPDEEPLLSLSEPEPLDTPAHLDAALRAHGYALRACATCRHWQPNGELNDDHLPSGQCGWSGNVEETPPALIPLTTQSGLALDCAYWQEATGPRSPALPKARGDALPRAAVIRKQEEAASSTTWKRLKQRLKRSGKEEKGEIGDPVVEQSGAGAGTEPCLACQGRMANLWSRSVRTQEGDVETHSLWRCRRCHTLYLNHWIDRWGRLDRLETEESIYRIAPVEAVALLGAIGDGVSESDAPSLIRLISTRPPLSHQVKQGR